MTQILRDSSSGLPQRKDSNNQILRGCVGACWPCKSGKIPSVVRFTFSGFGDGDPVNLCATEDCEERLNRAFTITRGTFGSAPCMWIYLENTQFCQCMPNIGSNPASHSFIVRANWAVDSITTPTLTWLDVVVGASIQCADLGLVDGVNYRFKSADFPWDAYDCTTLMHNLSMTPTGGNPEDADLACDDTNAALQVEVITP